MTNTHITITPNRSLGGILIYITLFIIGIILIVISANFFVRGADFFGSLGERFDLHISTTDIDLPVAGTTITVNIAKNDRLAAWRIYTQLSTRIAATDFNEEYDSALLVHGSLHKVFELIREEIASIPVERFKKDRSANVVKFYMDILNEGIRPHLSKWHIPLSKFVENEEKSHPNQSILEIEKRFPNRKELIDSIKAMNKRMKWYSEELLKIAQSSK